VASEKLPEGFLPLQGEEVHFQGIWGRITPCL